MYLLVYYDTSKLHNISNSFLYKLEGGSYIWGAYNRKYLFVYRYMGLKLGGGELINDGGDLYPGGLIIGSIYLFTGTWALLISAGVCLYPYTISGMTVANANSRLREIFRHVYFYSLILFT